MRTKIAVMQALAGELRDTMQEDAGKISDADVEKYYNDHKTDFEQADVERLIIPKTPQPPEADKDAKPMSKASAAAKAGAAKAGSTKTATAAKSGVKAAAAKPAAKPMDEAGMAALAAKLQARAAAGEDFKKLQDEAFKAANIKGDGPDTKMPKATRAALPPKVFDLKDGETSELITDARAFFVYKMGKKTTLTLDEAKNDVKTAIKNDRMQSGQKALGDLSTTTLNDAYFGPAEPTPGPGGPGRPGASDHPPSN